ncbi:MAG: hypothetical protein JWQ27_2176, partial [Ferruginibacter sp.]|nr:hypothetical protein [Ferruginibacter sp.]
HGLIITDKIIQAETVGISGGILVQGGNLSVGPHIIIRICNAICVDSF